MLRFFATVATSGVSSMSYFSLSLRSLLDQNLVHFKVDGLLGPKSQKSGKKKPPPLTHLRWGKKHQNGAKTIKMVQKEKKLSKCHGKTFPTPGLPCLYDSCGLLWNRSVWHCNYD